MGSFQSLPNIIHTKEFRKLVKLHLTKYDFLVLLIAFGSKSALKKLQEVRRKEKNKYVNFFMEYCAFHGYNSLISWGHANEIKPQYKSLYKAALGGHLDTIDLLENTLKVKRLVVEEYADIRNRSLTEYAEHGGHHELAKILEEREREIYPLANVEYHIFLGACKRGDLLRIKTIIKFDEYQAMLREEDDGTRHLILDHTRAFLDSSETPYQYAAKYGHLHLLQFFDSIIHENFYFYTISFYAAKHGHLHIIKWACETFVRDNETMENALLYQAARHGRIEIIRYIYETYGIFIHKHIRVAAENDNLETVKYFHEMTIKLKRDKMDGVLAIALQSGNLVLIEWVYSQGYGFDDGFDFMLNAIMSGNKNVVLWLEKEYPYCVDNYNPMCYAMFMKFSTFDERLDMLLWLMKNFPRDITQDDFNFCSHYMDKDDCELLKYITVSPGKNLKTIHLINEV